MKDKGGKRRQWTWNNLPSLKENKEIVGLSVNWTLRMREREREKEQVCERVLVRGERMY